MMKIGVCSSSGDPESPRTWSGTPFNIVKQLRNHNMLGITIDLNMPKSFVKIICKIVSFVYYSQRIDLDRGAFLRYLRSFNLSRKLTLENSRHVLHIGSLSLPFMTLPKNQKHYLFCDATWNTWSKYATNISAYSKRMLKDAEILGKKSYNQVSHIFTASEYVKSDLIEHYGIPLNKITVVGTGRGVVEPYYGEKNYENRNILFVAKGRLEDKGGHIVVEAFKLARKQDPDLKLTIVGQENYKGSLKDIPGISLHGFVPINELQNLFNTHSIFAMPAINEPWGLVYLEALSCKMPIIGLNRNAFPEISQNGKYGFILDEESPQNLSDLFLKAFRNTSQLESMGRAGQDYCLENFSWEKTIKKIIQVINCEDIQNG